MDNVIPFPKDKILRGWDLACAVLCTGTQQGMDECQKLLDDGYEPFAVSTQVEYVSPDILHNKPRTITYDKIWMKRVSQIENGKTGPA